MLVKKIYSKVEFVIWSTFLFDYSREKTRSRIKTRVLSAAKHSTACCAIADALVLSNSNSFGYHFSITGFHLNAYCYVDSLAGIADQTNSNFLANIFNISVDYRLN